MTTEPANSSGSSLSEGAKASDHEHVNQEPWWKVMCLTGVDYFSSMGFQPSIAYVAAGLLSPLATLILVLLTWFGALPAYWLVARESPHGQGSFAIFERLLKGWLGKTLVLILLGFAATDFVFTITMCAADATVHIVENPFVPEFMHNRMLVTLGLIAVLGIIFFRGFGEAITVSFWLVASYLAVNAVTMTVCVTKVLEQPQLVPDWTARLYAQYHSVPSMLATAALVFPQLALGLSGFETGVAVMPLIKTRQKDEHDLTGRIKNTRLLLVTVAIVMGILLIAGSVVTTLLIPAEYFVHDGPADGRALSYLAHLHMGDTFGTVYDIATILTLWFAGASGMAALLSLVPNYLPRYGMAPTWAGARRPLVVFFTVVSFLITAAFHADVDSQAGAFATGLLVLVSSAAIAVTLATWHKGLGFRLPFVLISLAFVYSSIAIIWKRPDGLAIAIMFIVAVLVSSIASRAMRSTELRIGAVNLDETAAHFIEQSCREHWGEVRILAHRPDDTNYQDKELEARKSHSIQNPEGNFIFLEVSPSDVSEFVDVSLDVTGHEVNGYPVLRCASPGVPNAIAALLLHVRDKTEKIPHVYFGWTEGHPIAYVFKYILFGEGETAPLTREILRSSEPDPERRPRVHVG